MFCSRRVTGDLPDGFLLSILRYLSVSVMMTGERDFTVELKLKFQSEFFSHENKSVFGFAAVTVLHLQFAVLAVKPLNS